MADNEDIDEDIDDGREIPGFSDAEIAEQIAPYLAEVDADYDAQLEPLVEAFRRKEREKRRKDQDSPGS